MSTQRSQSTGPLAVLRKLLLGAPLVLVAGCLDFSGFQFPDGGGPPADAAMQQDAPDLAVDPNADNDHDGWSIARGDCDDTNPFVNPGAYDFPGNGIDDNCDGRTDERPTPCDARAASHPEEPDAFAGAFEICRPWLVSATWDKNVDSRARNVKTAFGARLAPLAGMNFGILSTGLAGDERTTGYVSPRPGTDLGTTGTNPLGGGTFHNPCSGSDVPVPVTVNDPAVLTLKVLAPTNATGFRFRWAFFTAEYPPPTNLMLSPLDTFGVVLDGKVWKGNIVFDRDTLPISGLSPFITSCTPSLGCPAHACPEGTALLAGTGYQLLDATESTGGATGWFLSRAPVRPGETFTLTFFIYDAGDHLRDSTVVIDGFEWLAVTTTCNGGPCVAEEL